MKIHFYHGECESCGAQFETSDLAKTKHFNKILNRVISSEEECFALSISRNTLISNIKERIVSNDLIVRTVLTYNDYDVYRGVLCAIWDKMGFSRDEHVFMTSSKLDEYLKIIEECFDFIKTESVENGK